MFREHLRPPLSSSINPIVKAYIYSESFLWSGWYLVIPIAALFVVNNISGGNIQLAAFGYSIYLTTRVIFELISGRFLSKSTDKKKLYAAAIGVFLTSMALISFAYSQTILQLLLSYILAGMGVGTGAPAKNALFSIHIDKDRETAEWGIADGVTFICTALATALGGFIAMQFGFTMLFVIAGSVSLLGLIPYLLVAFDSKS